MNKVTKSNVKIDDKIKLPNHVVGKVVQVTDTAVVVKPEHSAGVSRTQGVIILNKASLPS